MKETINGLFFFNSTVKNKQKIVDWFNSLDEEKQDFVYTLMREAKDEALFFEQGN